MIDLISEEKHETLYKDWKESFEKLVHGLMDEEKDKEKKVIFVAMSRKMPRLIEMVNKRFSEGDLKNFSFVSEQALPYVLSDKDVKQYRIVIADDAMYYGSTINRISGYIRALTSVKPYVFPVAISEVVGPLSHAEVQQSSKNTIRVNHIPFLTTQNAEWILRLNRPIDVEFPILHFDIASVPAKEGVSMEEVLENKFPQNDIYTIKHQIKDEKPPVRNYNVLPVKGSDYDRWNKDFCKMRFFVSDQSVQVVAYAPGILPEAVVNDSQPLFSDERIQHLWEEIRLYDLKSWPAYLSEGFENDLLVNRFQSAYNTQCVRSKIIWANYLASYLYLLEQKEAIIGAITSVYGEEVARRGEFKEKDTQLLLPPEKVKSITGLLTAYFKEGRKEKCVFHGLHSAVLANQELVPEEYLNDYSKNVNRGLQRCRTADEALSVIFSSQHFFVNNGRLTTNALQLTQRLGFGITYTTLENKLSFPIGINGLWCSIHRWIDKNIDEGTVKPKYERVVVDGNAYWLRMFRAGENEDSFTKLRRLCEFVIDRVRQKDYRSYVERDVVDNLLTLVWEDPCDIVKYKYKWDVFVRQRNDMGYQLTIGGHSFVDFLIDQGYLQAITDSEGNSRVSVIDDKHIVTPCSLVQEQAIADYVDAYYYYATTRNQPFIMNNFFQQEWKENFGKDNERLAELSRQFAEYMRRFVSSEEMQESLYNDFFSMSEMLSQIIHQSMKVTNITIPEDKNANRRKISEWLQTDDDVDYMTFRNKVLAFFVIQELFNQLFMVPEKERDSLNLIENYLHLFQDDDKAVAVIKDYLAMSVNDRQTQENRTEVVNALVEILHNFVG